MKLKIKVPATSANLGPGFDCLGVALDLYNEFEVEIVKDSSVFEIKFEKDKSNISTGKDNIIYEAMRKVCKRYNKKVCGLKLNVKNNIPISRGLGSSASAYVAGTVIGMVMCGKDVVEDEVINIASELEGHPDNVVPAVMGGLCVSSKVFEKDKSVIKYIKFFVSKDLIALLLIPAVKISTKEARKILPKKVLFSEAVRNVGNSTLLVSSILKKEYSILRFATEDYLHQPYRKKLMPWLTQVFEICKKNKCLSSVLSGSGSTILSFYEKKVLTSNLVNKVKNLVEAETKLNFDCKKVSFSNSGMSIRIF